MEKEVSTNAIPANSCQGFFSKGKIKEKIEVDEKILI